MSMRQRLTVFTLTLGLLLCQHEWAARLPAEPPPAPPKGGKEEAGHG